MAKEKIYSELTTPFFIEDNFFSEVEDYANYADIDDGNINELSDDYSVDVDLSTEEKIFKADEKFIDHIMDRLRDLYEDRYPADEMDDKTDKKIKEAITASIDLEKLNSLLPTLWYPNGKISKVTKQDLIDVCK